MKNKIKRYILIILFVLIIVNTTTVLASEFTNGVKISRNTTTQFQNVGNRLLGIAKVIGILTSVGALILMGITYFMASVEEKAEYKKKFIPYIVGAILVFGICSLGEKMYNLVQDIL